LPVAPAGFVYILISGAVMYPSLKNRETEPKFYLEQTEAGTTKIFMLAERPKLIGEIFKDILIIHKKQKDVFRKGNAIGLSNKVLTSDKLQYTFIEYHIEGAKYITTRSKFISDGFYLKFTGYEVQRFLCLDHFNKNLEVVEL